MVRSILGLVLLVLGAMTLIALLPTTRGGSLTSWWTDLFAPWFGTMRWLLPFFLLASGWWLEWGPGKRPGSGWGITVLGLVITYAGVVGAAQVINVSGGRIGRFLAGTLGDLVSPAGAFILLIALAALGLVVGFGIPLRQLLHPAVGTARWVGSTAKEAMRRTPPETTAPGKPVTPADAPTNGRGKGGDRASDRRDAVAWPDRGVG